MEVGQSLSTATLALLKTWSGKKNIYLNEGFLQLGKDGGNHISDPVCKAASSTLVISPENELVLPCYQPGEEHLPINGKLLELYRSEKVKKLVALERKFPACEGCTINCYMQPSFTVEMNKYWWKALPSTIKYNTLKGTWKQLIH